MSTHRSIDILCVAVLVLGILLTVLFMNGDALGIERIVDEDAEAYSDSVYFTANDLDGGWDDADATVITLTGTGATISGGGAYAYDGDVYISNGGYYVLSGALTDGSIVVDAYASSKIWLKLDGVSVACSDGAALRIEQADKVFLTLADGTENALEGGDAFSESALADGVDGAVFARDDLTVNGGGSLAITAPYGHGIEANDDLVITGGTITVDAAEDGIHANDSLRIAGAAITVTAGDDGAVVSNEGGFFYIESGSLAIDCDGDGIHAAGDVTVVGGSLTIAAEDDGIHSDAAFAIMDGTVLVTECYEGIEAVTIDVAGGDVTIYPADDGFNANGGSGEMGPMGGFGGRGGASAEADAAQTEDGPAPEESAATAEDEEAAEDPCVTISGGTVTIINETGKDADGIDSNGDIHISGGTILVSLADNSGNSALDCGSENGGVAEITGGTILACGNSSMAESFDTSSSQPSILYNIQDGVEAGTTLCLEDADGNALVSAEIPMSFSSAVISCPAMALGETYLVVIGDEAEEVTLDEISASFGDAQSGGFGGSMHWGGMQDRANFGGRRAQTSGEPVADSAESPAVAEDDTTPAPGTMPADSMSGSDPNGGSREMRAGPGMGGFSGEPEAEEETPVSTAKAVTAEQWLWLGVSAAALLAGLGFALFYKRRR